MEIELSQIKRIYWITNDLGLNLTVEEIFDPTTESFEYEIYSPDSTSYRISNEEKDRIIDEINLYESREE